MPRAVSAALGPVEKLYTRTVAYTNRVRLRRWLSNVVLSQYPRTGRSASYTYGEGHCIIRPHSSRFSFIHFPEAASWAWRKFLITWARRCHVLQELILTLRHNSSILPLQTRFPVLFVFVSVQFRSVHFKMVLRRWGEPICAPPSLSEVSPVLTFKQFLCYSDCMTAARSCPFSIVVLCAKVTSWSCSVRIAAKWISSPRIPKGSPSCGGDVAMFLA